MITTLSFALHPTTLRPGVRTEAKLTFSNTGSVDVTNFGGELTGKSGLRVLGQDWFSGHFLPAGKNIELMIVMRIATGENRLIISKLKGSVNGELFNFGDAVISVIASDPMIEEVARSSENIAHTAQRQCSLRAVPARRALLVTALGLETAAVLRHLEKVKEDKIRGTVLHVGDFENWEVSVVEVGVGNIETAAVTERVIGHVGPEVALFADVAGGVKDVKLGDVVVATKIYVYESGKEEAGGFRTRPELYRCAYSIESRARALCQGNSWRTRGEAAAANDARLHIGPIAAGEKVVASRKGVTARFLREHYNDALAVEMEGGGFLAAIHNNPHVTGGVVRGISDLLIGKKRADRGGSQERAATTASAVAFEILATL